MIEVRDLWAVFGKRADSHFRGGPPEDEHVAAFAQNLRDEGLVVALQSASFCLQPGRILAVYGPPGAGKSILVRLLARLVEPAAGEIMMDGRDFRHFPMAEVRKARQGMFGMMFSRPALLNHLDAVDNIALPLRAAGIGLTDRMSRVSAIAEELGLDLSDGSSKSIASPKQSLLAAMARSLINDPQYWLIDSPMTGLSNQARTWLIATLVRQHRKRGMAMLLATDRMDEALEFGDDILILRGGAVAQLGSVENLTNAPASDYVQRLVSRCASSMTIDHMVEPAASFPISGGPTLRLGMSVTTATTLAATAMERMRVADETGRVVGYIRTGRLVGRPSEPPEDQRQIA